MAHQNQTLKEPGETFGDRMLSAWRVAYGVIWVQARDPKHAARLARRSDCRLVVRGVAGGYLRTYEFEGKTETWAQRLIARYTAQDGAGELEAAKTPIPA